MKIVKIDRDTYSQKIKKMAGANIYISRHYLDALSSIRDIEQYGIEYKENIVAVFPVLRRRKLFIRYFTEPPFTQYFNIAMKERGGTLQRRMDYQCRLLNTYSDYLRKNFLIFSIPQHPYLQDIRGFKWHGVKLEIFYTYHFDITQDNLQQIDRRIRNKASEDYSMETDPGRVYPLIESAYGGDPPIKSDEFREFCSELLQKDLLRIYTTGKTVIGLLIDRQCRFVYQFFVGGRNSGILLRDLLREEMYADYTLDLQGANTQSIARYKALFNPQLKQYFKIKRFI
ncbi:MAG: hypothetical protein SVK54_08815 [candidate division WOR-3 bacterium]|nr:hypothetical protein [candidate division WOR-3 bacterium]